MSDRDMEPPSKRCYFFKNGRAADPKNAITAAKTIKKFLKNNSLLYIDWHAEEKKHNNNGKNGETMVVELIEKYAGLCRVVSEN